VSALFQACNRGKRSIALDLGTDAGRDVLRRLAARSDVVLQNFRPGVMDRIGLGYDDLAAGRDDLVYVSLSGFGPTGPYAHKGAYDTVIQAYGGLAINQAGLGQEPTFLRQTAADKITAMYAVQAITAALLARERGAGGQHVELTMLDAVVSFLWADAAGNELMLDNDGSMASSFVQSMRPMRFLDGWGVATPTSDADFHGMCDAFDVDGHHDPRVEQIIERRSHPQLVRPLIDACYARAATMTTAEAIGRLEAHNVPCGVVTAPADLAADPHVQAVGLLEESVHPTAGRLRQPRHPAQFAATPAAIGGPSPLLGEHTDAVLSELGLTTAEIEQLRADATVA
jgi:crotonobetainyl-CoA:carnitine CoA-transferase CaiB-like acyl-CoA transferase